MAQRDFNNDVDSSLSGEDLFGMWLITLTTSSAVTVALNAYRVDPVNNSLAYDKASTDKCRDLWMEPGMPAISSGKQFETADVRHFLTVLILLDGGGGFDLAVVSLLYGSNAISEFVTGPRH